MIKQYRVNAIIFDLDGVLVDSMPAVRAYWVDWARRRGVAPEAVLAALHLTAEELVRMFAPGLDAVSEALATADGQARLEQGPLRFAPRVLVVGDDPDQVEIGVRPMRACGTRPVEDQPERCGVVFDLGDELAQSH